MSSAPGTVQQPVRNVAHKRGLNRVVADAGRGEFRRRLEYRRERHGPRLVVIDRWCPSSKTCSSCGYLLAGPKLKSRHWTCPDRRTRHDRDINAAQHIPAAGRAVSVSACGGDVSHSGPVRVQSPRKQEVPRREAMSPTSRPARCRPGIPLPQPGKQSNDQRYPAPGGGTAPGGPFTRPAVRPCHASRTRGTASRPWRGTGREPRDTRSSRLMGTAYGAAAPPGGRGRPSAVTGKRPSGGGRGPGRLGRGARCRTGRRGQPRAGRRRRGPGRATQR